MPLTLSCKLVKVCLQWSVLFYYKKNLQNTEKLANLLKSFQLQEDFAPSNPRAGDLPLDVPGPS